MRSAYVVEEDSQEDRMYRFWDVVMKPILDALEPSSIVEIGSDHGLNTKRLLDFCRNRGGILHVIDPLPKYDVDEWQRTYGDTLAFHRDLSLNALPEISASDLVLIDGDHNWYTVFNELKLLEQVSREQDRPFPLVMLHDVGWPYGRRDLYYDPDSIPREHRQPYRRRGMEKDSSELLEEGGLNTHLCNANHEGGVRNGVLTAVEDFMEGSDLLLDLTTLPPVNGLGILLTRDLKQRNRAVDRVIASLSTLKDESSPVTRLTALTEDERMRAVIGQQRLKSRSQDLEIRLKKVTDFQEASVSEQQVLLEKVQDEAATLRSQNKGLAAEVKLQKEHVGKLSQWMVSLNRLFANVVDSRQFKSGRMISEAFRRASFKPRERLAAEDMTEIFRRFYHWREEYRPGKKGHANRAARKPQGDANDESGDSKPGGVLQQARQSVGKLTTLAKARTRMSRKTLIKKMRERLGEVPKRDDWPFVSMVVLNRNGLSHLETLFDGLKNHTDYPDFEVVVVDNGSTDGSVRFLKEIPAPFTVRVIENESNTTFSDGNNQGVEAASGKFLLFLNNDIEPMDSGWLKEMVDCSIREEAAAVGAYLVYAEAHDTPSGYAVQHRGIKFHNRKSFPKYQNVGNGEDALDRHLGVESLCPAATAACLLMRREVFEEVGGFTSGYKYGVEDVDLGLKTTAAGYRVIASGRAVLFHHEFGTQDVEGNVFRRMNGQSNRLKYAEQWGPDIQRRISMDAFDRREFWTESPIHVALTVTSNNQQDGYGDWYTAHELGDALEKRGVCVSYVERKNDAWYSLPRDVDYLVVLIDQYDISRISDVTTVAWIRNWTDRWVEHPWFDDFDFVLASSQTSRNIVESRTNKTVTSIFPIAANPERFARTPVNFSYETDYVFTGNYWGVTRLLNDLEVAPGERFAIFGRGWPKVPRASRYSRGAIPYDELPKVYSSAKLVIDETTTPTLPYGAVNSRVFDALATGTLVITNCVEGVRELFDEDFPTYTSRRDLRGQLDRLLNDDAYRKELARRYQGMVLRNHTYDRRAEQLIEILRDRAKTLKFCIKIGAPNREVARTWGDLHFAKAIRKQFERRGHPCLIQTLDEWDNFEGLNYDVAIHLKGLTPYTPKPGQFNIMWNISHPEQTSGRECDGYDLVFVASERWAEELRNETDTPVLVLDQATDPDVFFPDYDEEHEHDMVFVGNSRKVQRRILSDLLPTEHDLAVWGGDWEGLIDDRHVVGSFLPNDQVRKAYSSASIVLNDHWDDMREHGFISNRIYDALACGALVISDNIPELKKRFGKAVVTYESPEELKQIVEHYLNSPEARKQQARAGMELVTSEHTFEKRVESLIEEMTQLVEYKARDSGLSSMVGKSG